MAREHYASAVVLTDWGAKTEGLSASRDALLQELLLLSLVYDQLLIQDEVLALSTKLARWFTSGKDFDLLRRCLSIGSIVILTHHAYGSDDLAELALRHPITARAKYIARRGTFEKHRRSNHLVAHFIGRGLASYHGRWAGVVNRARRRVGGRSCHLSTSRQCEECVEEQHD
ncbi:MAG TPA: hypothetical protein VHB47_13560, partial [Thermoanaerobaculia bacterium]|nr:hypothetical protein [Thermoanaerobaculia bacterium]